MPDPSLQSFATAFPAASATTWRALVDKSLKGGEFEKRLVSTTSDGLRLSPVYPASRMPTGLLRADTLPWRIAQRVDSAEPAAAAPQAVADLEGGADMLVLCPQGARGARGIGLTSPTRESLDASLAGVRLDLIAVRIEPCPAAPAWATALADLALAREHDPAKLDLDFGLDPIGVIATGGLATGDWGKASKDLIDAVTQLSGQGFTGPFVTVDLRPVHEAGGSEGQELAAAMATALAYLSTLEAGGIDLQTAAAALSFVVPVDADQFLGLAKLRALRRLWTRIETACGLSPTPIRIHAETSWRMATRRDPAVNMLRATLATFVAAVGGADTLTVLPHTLALGAPDAFARRVARNTQLVLLEESHLARVADPAAGSGAFEALTEDLARKAWSYFQDIEAEGGIIAALSSGSWQRRVSETRARRAADLARRKLQITGTSEFPNLAEPLPPQPSADAAATQSAAAPLAPSKPVEQGRAAAVATLPSCRDAEPFEALRDRADRALARNGTRPTVFLARLGPLADHAARSTWMTNLLAVGGIETCTQSDGFTASGAAGAAFAQSGATIAVITGSDASYAEIGEATAQALKSAGAKRVVLAGRPGADEAQLRSAGVNAFVFAGQDVVAFLDNLLGALDA